MDEQKHEMTVKLPRKNQQNDISHYKEVRQQRARKRQNINLDNAVLDSFTQKIKQNPELYFNFGFTYNDFKSYLMKVMYCRSVRNFIEKKRNEKIDQFNSRNKGPQYQNTQ